MQIVFPYGALPVAPLARTHLALAFALYSKEYSDGLELGGPPMQGALDAATALAPARFALFVMSGPGQATLARHGPVPVASPAGQARTQP